MRNVPEMTDKEIAVELLSQTTRNRVRVMMLAEALARMEAATAHDYELPLIDIRRMEIASADRVIELVAKEERARVRSEFRKWAEYHWTEGELPVLSLKEFTEALSRIVPEPEG